MGKELAEKYPAARQFLMKRIRRWDFHFADVLRGKRRGVEADGQYAAGILTCSVAVHRVLAEKGVTPNFVADIAWGIFGFVAAGALKFSDAVQLVRKRGQYMQEAVPAGQGAMAAIMGLSPAVVMDACKRAADGEVCSLRI